MSDYDYLPVSNGSGDAALMHITASRIIGGTTITVDSTTNVPAKFIGTYGTLLSTGLIDPTTKRDFKGHVIDGTHIGIDAFEPGSADSANLATGQIVVVKPNTGWGNRVAAFIKNATNFGTPENVTFAQITGTSLVNAAHDHSNSAGGGQLTGTAIAPGSQLADRLLNPYKFFVYLSGNTPAANNAPYLFDTKLFDTGSNYSTSTHKFVAPISGFYWLGSTIYQTTSAAGYDVGIAITVNGLIVDYGFHTVEEYAGSTSHYSNISTFLQLAAGDYVQIIAQTVAGSLNILGGSASANFKGFLVSKT